MRDPIERQDVFDLLNSVSPYIGSWLIQYIDDAISSIPSAQPEPEQNTMPEQLKMNRFGVKMGKTCTDAISRQDAIDALDNIKIPRNASWYPYYQQALTAMSRLPSAYPETDSFCTECKEYDSEWHFCPRFDRVIKRTLEEMGIIHCKDCKHWMPYDWMFSEIWQSQNIDDYSEDEIGCEYCDMTMKADDFCSRAERRTDYGSD